MVDDDKLFDEEDELAEIPDDEDIEDEDAPEIPDDDELDEEDELHPKHLNSLGFGVEEEDF